MNPYIIPPIIAFLVNILLAELIFMRFRFSTDRHILAYGGVTLSLALWSFGQLMTVMANTEQIAIIGNSIASVSFVAANASLLMFAAAFANIKWMNKSKLFPFFLLCIIVFFSVMAAAGFVVHEMTRASWGWWPVPGPAFVPMALCSITFALIAAGIMVRRLIWGLTSRLRLQAAIMVIAFIIPVLAGTGTDLTMRILGIPTFPLTVFFATVTAIVIAYAMLQFQFLDITPELAANTIADSMVEYLVVTDDDGAIRYANPSAQQAFGKEWKQLSHTSIDEYILGAVELLSDERIPTYGARAHLIRGGGYIPLSCNVSRFSSEALSGKILAMRDVSETEKLIDKLEKSTDELRIRETEFEHMNRVNVDREKEIVEMQRLIEEAKRRGGAPPNKVR